VGIYPSYQIFTSSQTCRFWSFSRRQSEVYRALNASQSSGICVAVSRSWPSCPISVARSIWNASTCAGCHQLTSLGSLATLPALEYLSVATCYRLERLPDLRSSTELHHRDARKALLARHPKWPPVTARVQRLWDSGETQSRVSIPEFAMPLIWQAHHTPLFTTNCSSVSRVRAMKDTVELVFSQRRRKWPRHQNLLGTHVLLWFLCMWAHPDKKHERDRKLEMLLKSGGCLHARSHRDQVTEMASGSTQSLDVARVAFAPMAQAVMAVGATDAAINSNHLKLLKLDFASSALDMPVLSSASVQERFNRLSWSKVGSGALEEFPLGLIAGGLADGSLHFWNPQKLLRCESK
jgi:hypothetical protein